MSDSPQVACRNYSKAHRHPTVIGKLQSKHLPFTFTMPQLAVTVLTFVVVMVSSALWGLVVPGVLRLAVMAGVPLLVGYLSRQPMRDGRSAFSAAQGWLDFLVRPREGELGGQPVRRRSAEPGGTVRFFAER